MESWALKFTEVLLAMTGPSISRNARENNMENRQMSDAALTEEGRPAKDNKIIDEENDVITINTDPHSGDAGTKGDSKPLGVRRALCNTKALKIYWKVLLTITLIGILVGVSICAVVAVDYNRAANRVRENTTPIRTYNYTDDAGVKFACNEYKNQTDCLQFLDDSRRELITILGNTCIQTKGSHFLPTSSPGYTIRTYHHDSGTEVHLTSCSGSLNNGGTFDSCAIDGNFLHWSKTASTGGYVIGKDLSRWPQVRHGVQIHKYFDTQLMSYFDYEISYATLMYQRGWSWTWWSTCAAKSIFGIDYAVSCSALSLGLPYTHPAVTIYYKTNNPTSTTLNPQC